MNDLKAVIWKEWRENLLQHGSVRRWFLTNLLLAGLIGVFLPLQFGRTTIDSMFLLLWIWMPLLNVIASVADTFAGERERHTLETLLASRLPDRAIVIGKVFVVVGQAWGVMMIGALLALLTVNLFKNEGELVFFPAAVAFGLVFLSLLGSIFIAAIGVGVSMRAATVRQAYQRIAIPLFLIVVVPGLAMSLLPGNMLAYLYSPEFAQNSLGVFVLALALALFLIDLLVFAVMLRRFHRPYLIMG
jgi:ABC-2 type transport system permease protein